MKSANRRRRGLRRLVGSGGLTLLIAASASAAIHRVDPNATGSDDGTSWLNAFTNLENALGAAISGDEIWVKADTYKPSTQSSSFAITLDDIEVLGGFNGTETDADDRDPIANVTILSGDLSGNDVVTITNNVPSFSNTSENCYHVVKFGNLTTVNTVLDGFTIKGGNASVTGGSPDGVGGGIMLSTTSTVGAQPTIRQCIVTENQSVSNGAGIFGTGYSDPTIRNSTILLNKSTGGNGGGVYLAKDAKARILNTILMQNAAIKGAGLYSIEADIDMIDSTVQLNTSTDQGAGVWTNTSVSSFVNCVFRGNIINSTFGDGGGMYAVGANLVLTITNCTFVSNEAADNGGGLGGFPNQNCLVHNSIFWDNTAAPGNPQQIQLVSGAPTVNYSDIHGGWSGPGTNNINSNPVFVSAATGNYRLDCSSPCIDVGDDSAVPCDEFDVDENSFDCITNPAQETPDRDLSYRLLRTVDMGAYESHGTEACIGDCYPLGGDGCVNIDDLIFGIVNGWGRPGIGDVYPQCGGNGVVDIDDLLFGIVNNWDCGCGTQTEAPTTVGDCWDTCSDEYPEDVDGWLNCYGGCIDALCKQDLIECD